MSDAPSADAKAAAALEEAKELAKQASKLIQWLLTHTINGKPK